MRVCVSVLQIWFQVTGNVKMGKQGMFLSDFSLRANMFEACRNKHSCKEKILAICRSYGFQKHYFLQSEAIWCCCCEGR